MCQLLLLTKMYCSVLVTWRLLPINHAQSQMMYSSGDLQGHPSHCQKKTQQRLQLGRNANVQQTPVWRKMQQKEVCGPVTVTLITSSFKLHTSTAQFQSMYYQLFFLVHVCAVLYQSIFTYSISLSLMVTHVPFMLLLTAIYQNMNVICDFCFCKL